jgi:hypothetical protein
MAMKNTVALYVAGFLTVFAAAFAGTFFGVSLSQKVERDRVAASQETTAAEAFGNVANSIGN